MRNVIAHNQFENNISLRSSGSTNAVLYVAGTAANNGTQSYGNIFLTNSFGVAGTGFVNYAGNESTYAALDAAYGGAMNNVQLDPMLDNPSAEDFALGTGSPARSGRAPMFLALALQIHQMSVQNESYRDMRAVWRVCAINREHWARFISWRQTLISEVSSRCRASREIGFCIPLLGYLKHLCFDRLRDFVLWPNLRPAVSRSNFHAILTRFRFYTPVPGFGFLARSLEIGDASVPKHCHEKIPISISA